MFAKPYKSKAVNTLKNSEKKQLAQRIKDEFPAVSEEKIKELVPVKASASLMKLVVHSGATVGVYVVEGVPVLLEVEGALVPTVCALWKAPEMLPTIIIQPIVMQKMLEGAPLYLPGVVVPPGGVGFPLFARGALLAAAALDNAARAVVGRAALSSADMLMKTGGSCLEVIHTAGDQLCREPKFSKVELPRLGPACYSGGSELMHLADSFHQLQLQPSREQWPALGGGARTAPAPVAPAPAAPAPAAPALIPADGDARAGSPPADDSLATETDLADESTTETEDSIPSDMDGLLKWCLLTFLKLEGKQVELPLKTSLLYRHHLVPLCPPGRTLDVKKSTYKKMGKFLEAMQREGLIEVREIERGVDAVTRCALTHPLVRGHAPPAAARAQLAAARAPPPPAHDYEPPVVRELLCVTAHVLPLFPDVRKGTGLAPAAARAALVEYVRARRLEAPAPARGRVLPDAALAGLLGRAEQEAVPWETLMAAVTGRMTPATEMRFADGSVRLSKSKLDPIRFQVASRAGNKKVTLVSNLEQFGFHLPHLARACQLAAGASCGVTRAPGASADQLLLQGDQTHFMAKLLIEKYGLPKKFVEGADKALNKKK